MPSHRSDRWVVYGDGPEIEKLWNSRYRIVFRCQPPSKTEDWYYENEDRIFADFGDLWSAAHTVDGIDPKDGEAYPNMVLVEQGLKYTPTGEWVIEFVYETLTTSFVQEKDDTTDYELNGLRRVTRTLVAQAGTDYQKTVGTDTITHQIDTETAVTLYLAGYAVDDTDAKRTVQEQWVEAGTLDESTQTKTLGVREKTYVFLAVEGTTVGPVIAKREENIGGLKTITVTTLQDKNGNALGADSVSSTVINEFQTRRPFTYPGHAEVVETTLREEGGGASAVIDYSLTLNPPVQSTVPAKTFVYFQSSDDLSDTDYINQSNALNGVTAAGYWNPTSWAKFVAQGVGVGSDGTGFLPFTQNRGLRSYRCTAVSVEIAGEILLNPTVRLINGQRLRPDVYKSYALSGGPPDPSGNTYVLDIQFEPAFEDIDGVSYFKKEITVSYIPPQGTHVLTAVEVP